MYYKRLRTTHASIKCTISKTPPNNVFVLANHVNESELVLATKSASVNCCPLRYSRAIGAIISGCSELQFVPWFSSLAPLQLLILAAGFRRADGGGLAHELDTVAPITILVRREAYDFNLIRLHVLHLVMNLQVYSKHSPNTSVVECVRSWGIPCTLSRMTFCW